MKTFRGHTCLINPLRKNSHSRTRYYQQIIKQNVMKNHLKGPKVIFNKINENSDLL